MKVKEAVNTLSLEILTMPDPEREIDGAYAGDLLSWVMGRASADCVWATIMTNMNVVAVASLVDTAAVVICEDSECPDDIVKVAEQKSVNLFRSKLPIYEFCVELSKII